jgi:hypothetical protein
LSQASREIGLEENTVKTKQMVVPRHPNAGQSRKLLIANKAFEHAAKFKYWEQQ